MRRDIVVMYVYAFASAIVSTHKEYKADSSELQRLTYNPHFKMHISDVIKIYMSV